MTSVACRRECLNAQYEWWLQDARTGRWAGGVQTERRADVGLVNDEAVTWWEVEAVDRGELGVGVVWQWIDCGG